MYYDILKNKTFYCIGDSYIAGDSIKRYEVWPALLAEKYGMQLENYGDCGSSISSAGANPMVFRFDKMKDGEPDIVLLEGGRNDFNACAKMGNDDDRTPDTFKGALNLTIEGLREKYPRAMIFLATPWYVTGDNEAGGTVFEYIAAMLDIAERQGVYAVDASDRELTGVLMDEPEFRRKYCIGPEDVSHLNTEGMKLALPAFEKKIAEFYQDFTNNK